MAEKRKHIMLSYQWDSQELVKRIHAALKKEGVEVWLDIVGGMKGNINAAMAEGVEGAGAICCVMTAKYQGSRNCQKELNYADVCAIPIVPIMGQKNWKQSNWLGVMTANLLWTDFTDEAKFESSVKSLLKELNQAAPALFEGVSTGVKPVKEMTVEEVCAKLVTLDLHQYVPVFQANAMDGATLSGLNLSDLQTELGVKKFHVAKIAEAFDLGKLEEKKKEEGPVDAFLKATTVEELRTLLEAKCDIEATDKSKGDSVLILAARRGDAESVDFLLSQSANVNVKNKQKINALMAASMGGHTAVIKLLLAKGATVNDRAEGAAGDSALSLAVYKNYTEAALVLMEAGADINRIDDDDQDIVLLDAAIHRNHVLIAKMIEKKALINHQNIEGNTALHNAAKNGSHECTKLLMEAKADPRIKNREAKIPLQVSQEFQCSKLLLSAFPSSPADEQKKFFDTSDPEEVRSFLAKYPHCVEIATPDKGDTKLVLAARANQPPIVMALVNEFHANVNNPNMDHSSPLMASAMRGYDQVVKFLLTKGANINQRTKNLDSPLSLAVWKDHTATAKILIQAGANVTGIDRFGDSMLHDASKNGNLELVQYFLTKEMNINHQNNEGYAPLHRAANFKQASIVKTLLDAKADFTLVDKKGLTPLQLVPPEDDVSRVFLQHAAKLKAEAELRASEVITSPSGGGVGVGVGGGGGGGGGGLGVYPELTKILYDLVGAVKEQTAEIRILRLAVEHMKK